MTIYSAYAKPHDGSNEGAVFVPQSFSWAAFIFGGLWALAHRMWIVAAILLAGMIAASVLPDPFSALMQLALVLTAGIFAAELRGWSLRRGGYAEVGDVTASSFEEAELKFFLNRRRLPVEPASAGEIWTDTLGLFGKQA
jgi:Protein of unknown function (DUF2628)